MKNDKIITKQMTEINRLSNELDCLYHNIAQNYGISDTIFLIFSVLSDKETDISQADLCNNWYYSKQTINSAVAAMIKKGWIELETIPNTRNKKRIVLTEDGADFCHRVIGETVEIEFAAYSEFTQDERDNFIKMFEKMNGYMRKEYDKRHPKRKA